MQGETASLASLKGKKCELHLNTISYLFNLFKKRTVFMGCDRHEIGFSKKANKSSYQNADLFILCGPSLNTALHKTF